MSTPNINIANFKTKIVTLDPELSTSAYAAGDVLFVATAAALSADTTRTARGTIRTAALLDKDDQAAQTITLYFFNAAATLGTINAAISISDADAAKLIGTAAVTTSTDLINSRFGQNTDIGLPFDVEGGTIYVAATTAGTPTHSSAGIQLRLSVEVESIA